MAIRYQAIISTNVDQYQQSYMISPGHTELNPFIPQYHINLIEKKKKE